MPGRMRYTIQSVAGFVALNAHTTHHVQLSLMFPVHVQTSLASPSRTRRRRRRRRRRRSLAAQR